MHFIGLWFAEALLHQHEFHYLMTYRMLMFDTTSLMVG
jgi:hypothetical protein